MFQNKYLVFLVVFVFLLAGIIALYSYSSQAQSPANVVGLEVTCDKIPDEIKWSRLAYHYVPPAYLQEFAGDVGDCLKSKDNIPEWAINIVLSPEIYRDNPDIDSVEVTDAIAAIRIAVLNSAPAVPNDAMRHGAQQLLRDETIVQAPLVENNPGGWLSVRGSGRSMSVKEAAIGWLTRTYGEEGWQEQDN